MQIITPHILIDNNCFFVMAPGWTEGSNTIKTSIMTIAPAQVSCHSDPVFQNPAGNLPIVYQILMNLIRTCSSVRGTFSRNFCGSGMINGFVTSSQLICNWTLDYDSETDFGLFVFVPSEDKNSITDAGISVSDFANTFSTTQNYWNGVRSS